MAIPQGRLLRDLRKAFQITQTTMSSLHDAVQIRPENADEVVQVVGKTANIIDFECRPVVCFVPERAGAPTADVYIVFEGLLSLRTDSPSNQAITTSYSTNFAYFRTSDENVTHAFGGHYDFIEGDIAHPRAHLQMRSQAEMWNHAKERFHSLSGLAVRKDPMSEILNRVRAPSAQMDFLSFMVQVAADHLVYEKSAQSTRTRFRNLTATCTPFAGYEVAPAHECRECHRGPHWYPRG